MTVTIVNDRPSLLKIAPPGAPVHRFKPVFRGKMDLGLMLLNSYWPFVPAKYRRACQSAVNVADPKPADWGESQIGRP